MTDILTLSIAAVGAAVLITAPSMGPTVPIRKGLAWIVARVAWWGWWALHPDAVRRSRLDAPEAVEGMQKGREWAKALGAYYASCPLCLSVWTAAAICGVLGSWGSWGAAWGVLVAPALVWGVTSLSGRLPATPTVTHSTGGCGGCGGCGGNCGKAGKAAKADPPDLSEARALNGSRASV